MSGSHLSKQFFELVKAIGESKSKQEEDRIITAEVNILKGKFAKKAKPSETKEFLVRLIYCEMLGHDGSFGYIHAVQLSARENLVQKKTAYLACAQMLRPDHELRFMMVNQLQRDLQSINHLQICTGLIALAKLGTKDMIPAMIGLVAECLKNNEAVVRKKAIMVMHRFYQLDNASVEDYHDHFRRTLCDKDPSVMGSALHVLGDLAEANPLAYKDLVPSYVSILKQITEHRLPKDYDYHRMPAPWIQIKLLQILAILGATDQASSEGMYEVILEVMRRADTGINVGYAIIYESVKTITSIYPNNTLLDAAAGAIGRFIASSNHNLRYLGITGLASIVQDHPRYAAKHQLVVMDCLEDQDETLRRKTLELLYRMSNPVNVETISTKMIDYLKSSNDDFLRKDLVSKITGLAERYAPSNEWYIQTMARVFETAGEFVQESAGITLIRLIAEGSGGEDDEADENLRIEAVETFLDLLEPPEDPTTQQKKPLPHIAVYVIAWVLGEYAYVLGGEELPDVCDKLVELAENKHTSSKCKAYCVTAMLKLAAQMGRSTENAIAFCQNNVNVRDTNLHQRCGEFLELIKDPELMQAVLPVDASCEDLDIDENMSFLDDFVQQALDNGAQPYNPPDDLYLDGGLGGGDDESSNKNGSGLKFDAYAKPTVGGSTTVNSAGLVGGVAKNDGGLDNMDGLGLGLPSNNLDSQQQSSNSMQDANTLEAIGASGPWGASGHIGMSQQEEQQQKQQQEQQAKQNNNNNNNGGNSNGLGIFDDDSLTGSVVTVEETNDISNNNNFVDDTPKEPVISERERQAAALFGGIVGGDSGSTSKTSSAGKRSSGRARRAARRAGRNNGGQQQQQQKPAPQEQEVDLLGGGDDLLGMGSTNDSNSNNPPAPQSTSNDDDLLGLAFGGGGNDNPPPQVQQNNNTATDDVMGLFGDMGSSNNNNNNNSSNNNSSSSGTDDLLGGFMMGGTTTEQAPPQPLLSPTSFNTQQFGGNWGSHTSEMKITVPSSVNSPQTFMTAMQQGANLQAVQAIVQTGEAICAGMKADGNIVLVHGKIMANGVLLTVRTKDPGFTQTCLDICKNAL